MQDKKFSFMHVTELLNMEFPEDKQVTYNKPHNVIEFNIDGITYDVDLNHARTPAEILQRALHLSEKNWMTLGALRRFIELALSAARIDIYGNKPKQKQPRLFEDRGPGPDLSRFDYKGGPF